MSSPFPRMESGELRGTRHILSASLPDAMTGWALSFVMAEQPPGGASFPRRSLLQTPSFPCALRVDLPADRLWQTRPSDWWKMPGIFIWGNGPKIKPSQWNPHRARVSGGYWSTRRLSVTRFYMCLWILSLLPLLRDGDFRGGWSGQKKPSAPKANSTFKPFVKMSTISKCWHCWSSSLPPPQPSGLKHMEKNRCGWALCTQTPAPYCWAL